MPRRSARPLPPPAADALTESHATPATGADSPSRRAAWLKTIPAIEQRALRHVGLRITALRRQRRLTRAELAVAADLNAAHLGTIERGESNTTLLSLVRIAEALETDVTTLLRVVR